MIEKQAMILCPLCGSKFTPTFGNICQACTLASVQQKLFLSAGEEVLYCRFCQRYERPPWINCQRQSQQMLQLLLKKVKGLNRVKFKNAKFVWTQPHSKRMKIKLDIQRQINDKLKLQQSEVIQFVERYTQCPDCKKNFTPHDWNTVIQVRQHVQHKKTFHTLEQNILKQKWSDKVLKIQECQEGVDFFFKNEHDSNRYVEYIKSHLPVVLKTSKQLISHNQRQNTSNVKTTFSMTIPKLCRDDMVKIPPKLAQQYGNCSTFLLCINVQTNLYLMDITNSRKITMTASQYFKYEDLMQFFTPKIYGRQFIVLDNQGKRSQQSTNLYPSWGLTIMKPDQYKEIYVKSHLNLETDNQVLGYELTQSEDMQGKNTPDIVLFKKIKKQVNQKIKKQTKKKQQNNKVKTQQKSKKEKTNVQKKESKNKETSEEKKLQKKEQDQWVDVSDQQMQRQGQIYNDESYNAQQKQEEDQNMIMMM